MTKIIEIDADLMLPAEHQSGEMGQALEHQDDALAMAAIYQQIADRRAQTENADILRRARAL
jgi:hypothetical protein